MSSYRLTFPNSNLSEEQKEFYEKNGYLLVKNNVSDKLLNTVCQRFIDICEGQADDANVETIVKEPSLKNKGVQGQYIINKIQNFLNDEVLWKYISDPAVVNILEGIIGPNITAAHSIFINKPPNADTLASLHPLHQDLHYFPFRPPNKIVTSWTAVERVDEKNGCLYVLPGTHNGSLYKHEYPKGFQKKMYYGVQGMDHLPRIHMVMDRGDTLFFHPLLLHGSGPNLTTGFRKSISCHYADSNCYFIDVRGTSQENIAVELEALMKKRRVSLNFADTWKFKSRLVKGSPGSFQNLSRL